MLKVLAACAVLLMVSGTAWAQNGIGPDFFQASDTGTTGTKVLLNSSFATTPTVKREMFLYSTDGAFKVSGYRYSRGSGWYKVFPKFSSADKDTAVNWVSGVVLPVTQSVDLLVIDHAENSGTTKIVMYR